jgi:hypothetical protein
VPTASGHAFERWPVLLALSVCLLPGPGHAAEPDPTLGWHLQLQQDVGHDDNVFREADSAAAIDSTTLRSSAMVEHRSAPQGGRLVLGARAYREGFSAQRELDFSGHALHLAWNDATEIWQLNGGVARQLGRFGLAGIRLARVRNIERIAFVEATRLVPLRDEFNAALDIDAREQRNSAPTHQFLDVRRVGLGLRIEAGVSDQLVLGAGLRHADATRPRALPDGFGGSLADDFRRSDLEFTLGWQPTETARLDGRLSRTRERHDLDPARDLDDWTASWQGQWAVAPAWSVSAGWLRESGRDAAWVLEGETSGLPAGPVSDTSDLLDQWQAATQFDFASAWSLAARMAVSRHRLAGTTNVANSAARDRTTKAALSLGWAPIDSVDLRCEVIRERRRVQQGAVAPYRSRVTQCGASVAFH